MCVCVAVGGVVSGEDVASDLGLTNSQGPCVTHMKKFCRCWGAWEAEKQSDMSCLYSEKAPFGSGRTMTGLGPPEAEMAATGLPAWIMWVWNKSREKVWGRLGFLAQCPEWQRGRKLGKSWPLGYFCCWVRSSQVQSCLRDPL